MTEPAHPKRTRRKRKSNTQRFMISLSPGLVELVDHAAERDFTTRSNIIRAALLWYLQPHEFAGADPEKVLKTLQQRQLKTYLNKNLKEPR